jgi:hypothetical protein
MAGTLTISTLSDGTNSTSSTNCIQGSAKAWINYKGTATRAINASYNVSSVTFNSTGNYTINFTNAMTDANYNAVFGSAYYASGSGPSNFGEFWAGTRSTTALQIAMQTSSASAYVDVPVVSVTIFR